MRSGIVQHVVSDIPVTGLTIDRLRGLPGTSDTTFSIIGHGLKRLLPPFRIFLGNRFLRQLASRIEDRIMTQLLEKAISEIKKLPVEEQDAIAAVIMAELEAERRWDNAFEGSHNELERLAEEALQEYRADKTEPLDPDRI